MREIPYCGGPRASYDRTAMRASAKPLCDGKTALRLTCETAFHNASFPSGRHRTTSVGWCLFFYAAIHGWGRREPQNGFAVVPKNVE